MSRKPPLRALARGVRMASVMTMSSAFFEVLSGTVSALILRRHHHMPDGGQGGDGLHGVERAARRQVLEDGAETFYCHCDGCGGGRMGEMEVMERMAADEMHGRDSVIYTWPTTEDGSGARRGR